MWDGLLYFNTRCPFGVRSSALVCQQTTQAVIHVFTKEGYAANVYLDDFYGAEHPPDARVIHSNTWICMAIHCNT